MMVNHSTNINNTNHHLSPQTIERIKVNRISQLINVVPIFGNTFICILFVGVIRYLYLTAFNLDVVMVF